MKRFLFSAFLLATVAVSSAATVSINFTNTVGQPDTNSFRVIPIGSAIAANGGFITRGPAISCRPNASGSFSTNLMQGNYLVTNAFLATGFLIAVPNSTGTYNAGDLAISGFNTYNYNPPGVKSLVSTNSTISIYSLGGGLYELETTNVITQGSNVVVLQNGTAYTLNALTDTNVVKALLSAYAPTNGGTFTNQIILFTDPQGNPWSFNGQKFLSLNYSAIVGAMSFGSDSATNPIITINGSLHNSASNTNLVPSVISVPAGMNTNLQEVYVGSVRTAWYDSAGIFHNGSDGSATFADSAIAAKKAKISGGVFTGDGSGITNYSGTNVIGNVPSALASVNASNFWGTLSFTNFGSKFFVSNAAPLNVVRDFAAPPGGLVPAQDAIQAAINYATNNGISDIYFPPGTYLLNPTRTNFVNGFNWMVVSVDVNPPPGTRLRFLGDGNAIFLVTNASIIRASGTNDSYTAAFNVIGAGQQVEFSGLQFRASVAPNPASKVTAILQGFDFNITTNLVANNNWFYNWGYGVYANTPENLTLNGNHFRYNSGRNCETDDGDQAPAAGIRFTFVQNADIHFNDWVGSDITNYTAQGAGLKDQAPMDNFVWGTAVRCNITHNHVRRNGVEGIFIGVREPQISYGVVNGTAQPGSHVIADNILEGEPVPGQSGVPYAGISYGDTEASIHDNQIKDCMFGVHMEWNYGVSKDLSEVSVINNRIQMPGFVTNAAILHHSFPGAGIDIYGYTNVTIQGNRISWVDRGDPSWMTNSFPYAGIYMNACSVGEISGNQFVSQVPYWAAPAYPTNFVNIYGVWVTFASTNIHVGKNFFSGLDAGVVTWSEPSWRNKSILVDEQASVNVRYPTASRGFLGSTDPAATRLDPHFHFPTAARRESVDFYAGSPGWYRVIIGETNNTAPKFNVSGKLTISADPTNAANADHMVYYVTANSPGTSSELNRVAGSSLTSGGALLGGARISSAGYPPAIAQVDVLTIGTNMTVSLWWESDHPTDGHLLSAPFLVPSDDTRVFEVSDTNTSPYAVAYTRPGRPFLLNRSWLEMAPGTNSGINPQSGGLAIGVFTNGTSGHQVLQGQDPSSGVFTIFDAGLGGVVQSNSLSQILAGTLTNGGFATNIIYPVESTTIGQTTNGQTVAPFIKPSAIDTNMFSASAWAWLQTLGNSNALWLAASNLTQQATNALATGAFTSSNSVWLNSSNLAKLTLSFDGSFAVSSNGILVWSTNGAALRNLQSGALVGTVAPSNMGTNAYFIAGNNVTITTNYSGGVFSYTFNVGTGGTVTSVGLTAPTGFSVSGGPVTTFGTLAINFTTEQPNSFLVGPTSGGAANPTWRVVVPADLASADAITNGQTTYALFKAGLMLTNPATGSFLRITNDSIFSSNALTGNFFYLTNDSVQITNRLTGHQAVITNGTYYGLGQNLTNASGAGANGTVTSVSMSGAPWFALSGFPITGSGTLVISNTAGVTHTNFNSGWFQTNINNGAWLALETNGHFHAVDEWGTSLWFRTNSFAFSMTNGMGFGMTNDTIYFHSNGVFDGSWSVAALTATQLAVSNFYAGTLVASNTIYLGTNTLGPSNVFQVDTVFRTNAFVVNTNGDARVNQTLTANGITNLAVLSADALATDANGKVIAATAITEAHVSGLTTDLSQRVSTNDSRNLVLTGTTNNLGNNVSATAFWGDGTHLTGVAGTASTTNVIYHYGITETNDTTHNWEILTNGGFFKTNAVTGAWSSETNDSITLSNLQGFLTTVTNGALTLTNRTAANTGATLSSSNLVITTGTAGSNTLYAANGTTVITTFTNGGAYLLNPVYASVFSGNLAASQIYLSTNAFPVVPGAINVDWRFKETLISTNANFTIAGFINASNTLGQDTFVYVSNSSASTITVTLPAGLRNFGTNTATTVPIASTKVGIIPFHLNLFGTNVYLPYMQNN